MNQTQQFIAALTGSPDAVLDWRVINDRNSGESARNMRGSLAELYSTLQAYNASGYGIFCNINQLDGNGHTLANVSACRVHVVDLDGADAAQQVEAGRAGGASFIVQTSPNKYHVYWLVDPYVGNDHYTAIQRKLAAKFNGDKSVNDATRVMRVPGFFHMKHDPFMVTFTPHTMTRYTASGLSEWLGDVTVHESLSARAPLGTPELAAPSIEWLERALFSINPNELERADWVSVSAAFKQAGWTLAGEQQLFDIWLKWCKRYTNNLVPENMKLWNSIRDTECGWATFLRRTTISAHLSFGDTPPAMPEVLAPLVGDTVPDGPVGCDSEILDAHQCAEWFKGCYWVERMGEIFTPSGRFFNATQFNGTFGGKQFIYTGNGKTTDEAWKAALRSTMWKIPSVDHVRFLPDLPRNEIVLDSMGRRGLNTYVPPRIDVRPGDVGRWLDWLARLIPDESDRDIMIQYLAHCVKYPGFKIPWAPMLQSAEGTGKTVFRELLAHCLGDMYVYQPKAPELVKSGSTFNAWMRAKLMIVVDEIKIDERRELIEILKPMIADNRVEIQSKGVDQEMEDNPANWLFFSNYKDAIPVNHNGRRYAIFYSALQSAADIEAAGMDNEYFSSLFQWLRADGYAAVAHYLLNYPIERGSIPMRAPATSSYNQAVAISRSPMEQIIYDCVADTVPGFCGGYVSSLALVERCRKVGMRAPSAASIKFCLEGQGYHYIGRAVKSYIQEGAENRAELFALDASASVEGYGLAQGYDS